MNITYEKALYIFSSWRQLCKDGHIDEECRFLDEKDFDAYMAKRFMKDLSKITVDVWV